MQDIAFLIVAAAATVIAYFIQDLDRLRRVLLGCTGVALIGLPVLRMMTGGPTWPEAWSIGVDAAPVVHIALVVFGFICLWAARARQPRASSAHEPAGIRTEAHSA